MSPIFVTGFPRSGTTLLGNILDRHPRIGIFVESFFIPEYYWTQIFHWPLTKNKNLFKLARAITQEDASVRNGLKLQSSVVNNLRKRTYPELLNALMKNWVEEKGKKRWGDKSPGYITKLKVLHRMYPEAKFIHIIRDGRDVWTSIGHKWEDNVVLVARDWAKSIHSARKYAKSNLKDKYLELRYEDLVAQPRDEIQKVLEFLNEEYNDAVLKTSMTTSRNVAFADWPKIHNEINSDSVRRWERELPEKEIVLFECHASYMLKEFGYSTVNRQFNFRMLMQTKGLAILGDIKKLKRGLKRRVKSVYPHLRRF